MDFSRRGSRREAIFFQDNPIPFEITWYRANPAAKVFPGAHKLTHLEWYSRPWEATGVGEVYGSPDRYYIGYTPPTACGDHYFGALKDFQNGATFDPLINVARDVWGIPLVCGCMPDQFVLGERSYSPALELENGGYLLLEH